MAYITVTPAYGRDYKSLKAAKADWEADKDFQMQPSGQYINRAQAVAEPSLRGSTLQVRYKKLTQIGTLEKIK